MADAEDNSTPSAPKGWSPRGFVRVEPGEDYKLSGAAYAELRKLSNHALAELLCQEFDRRRLDADGNPKQPEGPYTAAAIAAIALLSPEHLGANNKKAERLAAVANGAHTLPESNADAIRWISELVEATLATNRIPEERKADVLARTLTKRFGRPVEEDAVRRALAHAKRPSGRAGNFAILAGVIRGSLDDSVLREDARNQAKAALAKR